MYHPERIGPERIGSKSPGSERAGSGAGAPAQHAPPPGRSWRRVPPADERCPDERCRASRRPEPCADDALRHLDACPALVLNADYTPLSYYPLSLWPWQMAVKAIFLDRVDIVAHYDREIHSAHQSMRLPSVIALRRYRKASHHPAFTRFNLFLRDRFQCQYCGSPHDLTFDHVVPRAQGGRTTWENVTTACAPCNLMKGGRTPGQARMHIRTPPTRPTSRQLQEAGRTFPPHHLHKSWRDWLYWDAELDE